MKNKILLAIVITILGCKNGDKKEIPIAQDSISINNTGTSDPKPYDFKVDSAPIIDSGSRQWKGIWIPTTSDSILVTISKSTHIFSPEAKSTNIGTTWTKEGYHRIDITGLIPNGTVSIGTAVSTLNTDSIMNNVDMGGVLKTDIESVSLNSFLIQYCCNDSCYSISQTYPDSAITIRGDTMKVIKMLWNEILNNRKH